MVSMGLAITTITVDWPLAVSVDLGTLTRRPKVGG